MVSKGTGNNIKSLIEDATVEICKLLLSLQFIKKRKEEEDGVGSVYNLNFHFALLEDTRDWKHFHTSMEIKSNTSYTP